jgi:AcrR family transcriptional regulator
MIEPKSSDHESRRARRAGETRRRILASARRLFYERGFAAVTIEQVAEDADVAVQTVYAIHGSKRGILFALVDATRAETSGDAHRAELEQEIDPRRQVELLAAFATHYFASIHDIVEILRGAGTADEAAAAAWRRGEERRREKDHAMVTRWEERGAITRPAQEAEDILWALTGPDVYRLLVVDSGWDADRFTAWLDATLAVALLGSTARPADT